MRFLPVFFIGISAALMTGCQLAPVYERPVAAHAAAYPVTESGAGAKATELPWRTFFSDERLRRLIELALAHNLDLRLAVLRVEQSRAQYGVSRADQWPTLQASGDYTRSHATDRTSDTWNASLGVSAYELDFFGRVRNLNDQALEKFFATTEGQRSAQISLIGQVASQYFSLRQAEAQAELAEKTLATVRQSFDLIRAIFEAGASNELDLRTAESQVKTAQINALTYRRQIAQAENALTLLLGEPLPADLPPARPFDADGLLAAVAPGLPSDLLLQRPDVLQAEHTLKAANANIGAARAAFFPSITLTGSLGTRAADLDGLFDAHTGIWSFAPQVRLPLFSGGSNRANLDGARVSARIEVANYQKAIQTAFREVADALVSEASYTRELVQRADLIIAQRRRFDLATARYQQGEDSYLNVLSAQQDLYSAEQARLQTRYQALNSRLTLYRALGGGW